MTDQHTSTDMPVLDQKLKPLSQKHFVIFCILLGVELITAFYLASINPVGGYDENWYLINALHMNGAESLPYAFNRPPMLPILESWLGGFRWMIPALCHIGSMLLLFVILRRFVSSAVALGGAALFMVCGDLRLYNIMLLTEMPSILFMLFSLYTFIRQKHFLTGVFTTLALMTHWSMGIAVPVFALLYLMHRQWREGFVMLAGMVLAVIPFMFAAPDGYDNPIVGAFFHFTIQKASVNDWMYYIREFPPLPVALMIGGVASFIWVFRYRRQASRHPVMVLCVIMLGLIIARVILLQSISAKGLRYLVPMIPLLMILSVVMVDFFSRSSKFVRLCLWCALFASVMPDKIWYYKVNSLAHHPAHLLDQLQDDIAKMDPSEPIYTDFHDMAVMGRTARRAYPVTGPMSWHTSLWYARQPHRREDIPDGALYITWDTDGGEIIASSEKTKRGRLYLVRWKEGRKVYKASAP